MNIALPALVVFVLILPGFLFRSRFKIVERSSIDFSPFGLVVTEALIWAAVLHLVWLTFSYVVLDQRLLSDALFKLLGADPKGQTAAAELIAKQDAKLTLYFGTMIAFSYIAPVLARRAVTHWKMDRQESRFRSLLRFHGAPWYYLLTGADFEKGEEPDFIVVSAIVDTGGGSMLYSGVLEDFMFSPEGELDRLVLREPTRRPLGLDKSDPALAAPERFYKIESDYFVLRYSEAITLNIKYVALKPLQASATQVVPPIHQAATAVTDHREY